MKNYIIAILAVATLALAAMNWQQSGRVRDKETVITGLNQQITDFESERAEQAQRYATLQGRYKDSQSELAVKTSQVAQLQAGTSNRASAEVKPQLQAAGTDSKAPINSIAEMMKSPEMKDMIKTQQKIALSGIIDKNYAALFSSMQLSPAQSATLKDLISKKLLVDADTGVAMMTGEMDGPKRKEMLDQARTDKKAIDDQIKQFLGDQYYTQLQDYEKTQPQRTLVNGFKDQLPGGASAISPDQEQQLMQAMNAERQNFKFTTDYSDQSQFSGDFATYFTEERLQQYGKETDQLAQRYLTRAQSILPPEQFDAFQKYLMSQQQLQQTGLKMAAKMFAPQPSGK